jgi:hypothetical protein
MLECMCDMPVMRHIEMYGMCDRRVMRHIEQVRNKSNFQVLKLRKKIVDATYSTQNIE